MCGTVTGDFMRLVSCLSHEFLDLHNDRATDLEDYHATFDIESGMFQHVVQYNP